MDYLLVPSSILFEAANTVTWQSLNSSAMFSIIKWNPHRVSLTRPLPNQLCLSSDSWRFSRIQASNQTALGMKVLDVELAVCSRLPSPRGWACRFWHNFCLSTFQTGLLGYVQLHSSCTPNTLIDLTGLWPRKTTRAGSLSIYFAYHHCLLHPPRLERTTPWKRT